MQTNERGKLHIVQLSCGHFQRFRTENHCPIIGERVPCSQCTPIGGKLSLAIVRISPRHPTIYIACQNCSYRRISKAKPQYAVLNASKHAQQKRHKVLLKQGTETIKTIDWTIQDEIEFNAPPF